MLEMFFKSSTVRRKLNNITIQKIYRGYSIRNHIKFEGIRTAIAAIRTGRAEPNYQACNLLALRAFLTVPKVFLVFEKENVIALILKLMHLHQADLNIQRHGCYIMMMYFDYCNFTKSCINKIQKSIGTIDICSVIERLIEAMNNHTDNIDIQSCACKVLIDISLSFGVKQDHIASLGGLQCIIAAMNNHKQDGNVQKYACKILSWMCYDDKSTYQVASLGGMKCIVVAMSNHINNVDSRNWEWRMEDCIESFKSTWAWRRETVEVVAMVGGNQFRPS